MQENPKFNSESAPDLNSLIEKRKSLLQELEELYKVAPLMRKEVLAKYKSGEVNLEGYQSQISEVEAPINSLQQQISESEKEIRLKYIEDLNNQYPADEKRMAVNSMVRGGAFQNKLGENVQEGGSNASGVYPIKDTDLLAIEKTVGTYDFIGGLPAKMQDLPESSRIPRVLSVFVENNKTYQVVEKASGKQLDKMMSNEVVEIPQEHFDLLVKDIERLNKSGLQIDPSKNSNIFYDPLKGFILIDLSYNDPFLDQGSSQVDEHDLRAFILGGNNQNNEVLEKIRRAINLK